MRKRTPQHPWTDAQRATLERMHAEGKAMPEIAIACGHTAGSCQTTLSRLKRDRALGAALPQRRFWNAAEIAEMIRLREVEHMLWEDIDRKLGRALGCCCGKYDSLRRAKAQVSPRGGGGRIDSTEAERDRDARKQLEHPTLTAAHFGDPLPGRSALDRKRSAQA